MIDTEMEIHMGEENQRDRNDGINQSGTGMPPMPPQIQVPPIQQMSCGQMPPIQPSSGQVQPQAQEFPIECEAPHAQVQPGCGMPYRYTERPNQGSDGMALASLAFGIISILSCVWLFLVLPSAVAGLVLGCVYRGKGGKSGLSIAGIICSASGMALALLSLLMLVVEVGGYPV